MKKLPHILFILLLLSYLSYGQNEMSNCDSIIDYPDKEATINEYESISDMIRKELASIINECVASGYSYQAKEFIELIIDKKGKVISIDFKKRTLPEECLKQFEEKLLNTEYWSPGIVNKKPVCSKLMFALRVEL